MLNSKIETRLERIFLLEQLISLSVELHNLNAGVQRRWNLSIVQWLVLKKIVDSPGLSAGTLAEISKIHPSTLTPTLNRLEIFGLVYILERPSDHRRKFIIASWKGLEWARRSEYALHTALNRALSTQQFSKTSLDSTRDLTASLSKWIHQE